MITKKASEISDQEWETYTGIVIFGDGSKHWFLNGKRHRTDGPAVEYVGWVKYWYLNGQLHRTDGPAVEYDDGAKSWCYQDQFIRVNSQEEFEAYIKCLAFE